MAATALAASEYRVGSAPRGDVVEPREVWEAGQFLDDALLDVPGLPIAARALADTGLRALRAMLDRHVPPDSLGLRAGRLVERISAAAGRGLEQFPTGAPSLARGQDIYRNQCIQCHGAAGRGDGPKAVHLVGPPPTDLSDRARLASVPPLDMYRKIAIGVAGTGMPQYAEALSADDRWAVTMYVVTLRADEGMVRDGEHVYAARCASCHGAGGGSPRSPGALGNLGTQWRLSDSDLVQLILKGRPGTPMLGFAGVVDSAVVDAVVSYLRSLPVAEQEVRMRSAAVAIFTRVRVLLDSAVTLRSSRIASDAQLSFRQVEPDVRAYNPALAGEIEDAFAEFQTRMAAPSTPQDFAPVRGRLLTRLERAERLVVEHTGESPHLVPDPDAGAVPRPPGRGTPGA